MLQVGTTISEDVAKGNTNAMSAIKQQQHSLAFKHAVKHARAGRLLTLHYPKLLGGRGSLGDEGKQNDNTQFVITKT